jgi:glyoxylase-like metal-dependent hydrolase (beta-lactamase superfamily II)
MQAVRSRLVVLGALSALGGALVAGQQFGERPAALRVLKAAADVFVLNNDISPGNATAVVTSAGVILIDDKFAVDHDNIVATLKTVTDQPIRYVVNTHHHVDHVGGNARLLQLHVPIVASDAAWRNLSAEPDGKFIEANPGFPTVTFHDRATIRLGGTVAELHHLGRGHTNGDIVVHLPSQRVLVTGDLFTFGPATPQLIDYAGGGSAKEWTTTLDEALKLDFETVVPGHGGVATRADLRRFRDGTARLSRRVRQMVVPEEEPRRDRADAARRVRLVPVPPRPGPRRPDRRAPVDS